MSKRRKKNRKHISVGTHSTLLHGIEKIIRKSVLTRDRCTVCAETGPRCYFLRYFLARDVGRAAATRAIGFSARRENRIEIEIALGENRIFAS